METKLAAIAEIVNARLKRILADALAPNNTSFFFPIPNLEICDQMSALTLRGGKRIRAALMVAGYELISPNATKNASLLDAACAMELLQTYFLIHDDIMDDDPIRRGAPSVHVSLSNKYNDRTLGRNLAILAGDLACALQEYLVARLMCEESIKTTVQQIFSRMHMDVIFGQALDLLSAKQPGLVSPQQIVQRKTASYTAIGPLCIGAALAGAPKKQQQQIAMLATPLGIAFQYRDDFIGVFGNRDELGKPTGSDIKNNKRTVLIEDALANSTVAQRARLLNALGNSSATAAHLDDAIAVIEETGAKARCITQIDDLSQQITQALGCADYQSTGSRFVEWMSTFLAQRSA